MGAMIGGGNNTSQGGAFQQLAGLAMANAIHSQGNGRGSSRGYDRRDRQVSARRAGRARQPPDRLSSPETNLLTLSSPRDLLLM